MNDKTINGQIPQRMKTRTPTFLAALLLGCSLPDAETTPIQWDQIGESIGSDDRSNGLAVTATMTGARLRCAYQGLEGYATPEGLWLTSIVPGETEDSFRVTAAAVTRVANDWTIEFQSPYGDCPSAAPGSAALLATQGVVSVAGQTVRFSRSGIIEEYSSSMDGIRQDFVILERPTTPALTCSQPVPGKTNPTAEILYLELSVTGAKVEGTLIGAQLVLGNSGRRIAYSRLRVTDATGKELPARIEVATAPKSRFTKEKSTTLCVLVEDLEAVYPVRIDPTFSDENWISMNPSVQGGECCCCSRG